MTLKPVQERLISDLVTYARIKYPETEVQGITEAPADGDHIWVIVSGIDWDDEDKSMDFMEYLSLKQEDILVEYGYPISLVPISSAESESVQTGSAD
jgi:hypothetical protein